MHLRYLGCFLLFSLIYVASYAQVIEQTYTFETPSITQKGEYHTIVFNNTVQLGIPGEPSLPFFAVKFLLPPGEAAASIEFTGENEIPVEGSHQLLPRQYARPLSFPSTDEFIKNNDLYQQQIAYPAKAYTQPGTQFMNGYAIGSCVFTPVRYVPATGKLSYYQKVTIRIQTRPDDKAVQALANLPSFNQVAGRMKHYVQNPEAIEQYPVLSLRSTSYQYLIITPAQFVADFDTLVAFYLSRGIRTQIAASEHIDTVQIGVDLQEKIRNYILAEYQSNGIEYILLGGDVEHIPCRKLFCQTVSGGSILTGSLPSDLYYSAFDATWDEDCDSIWGELDSTSTQDEFDLYPEISVGRFPFSTAGELENMIHKTMSYQQQPVQNDLEDPLMAGEKLYPDPLTWGADYMNLLIGYHTDNGHTTSGIPPDHDIDSLYAKYQSWGTSDILSKVNNGLSFIHHVGHASTGYVMHLSSSQITNANFSQANGVDHHYPVVYTHGCSCGGFDNVDCIAEHMVKIDNFASAFVGNSRYGWFIEGTTDGPAEHLHREFIDAIYNDSLYWIGRALVESRIMTAPFVDLPDEYEPGAHRWNFYDINVLGDPLMALWTYEEQDIRVDYPEFIPADEDTMIVTVNRQNQALKNFHCALMQDDTLYANGITDSLGQVVLGIATGIQQGIATLTVCGYNQTPVLCDVFVSDYWMGYTSIWDDPGNWFSGVVPDSNSFVIIPVNPAGNHYPVSGEGITMRCKALQLEEGALFTVGVNDTLTIHGN